MPAESPIPTGPLNAYKILGIPTNAGQDAIQAAYRTLAKQFHPDRNGSPLGHRLMLVVNEAYDAVKTPERRAAHDASLRRRQAPVRVAPIQQQRDQPAPAAPPPAPAVVEPIRIEDLGPIHRRAHAAHGSAHRSGRVLEFGRYAGRSIEEVARVDRDWLEWFIRTPLGRPWAREVLAALG